MIISLYCDQTADVVLNERTQDLIIESPIEELRINAERSDGTRVWTPEEFETVARAYSGLRIRPVFWPHPGFNKEYADWTYQFPGVGMFPVLDIESQAVTHADLEQLKDDMLMSLLYGTITTHQGHLEASERAVISKHCPTEVQALSTTTAVAKWGDVARPGPCQRRAVEKGREVNGCVPGVCLPIYNQKGFGSPLTAMTTAFEACRGLGVEEVSYWSLKHLLKNGYAQVFMRDVLPELMGAGTGGER